MVDWENESCQTIGAIVIGPSAFASMVPWVYLLLTVPQRRGITYLERCHSYSMSSKTGLVIEIISAILSVMSCGLYIAGTYMVDSSPWWFQPAEVAMSTFFFAYWVMNFIIAPTKFAYATSLHSFVDILTVMPVLITTAGGFCEVQFGIIAAARVLKFFRVLRLLRVLRSFDVLADSAEDAIRRQTMRLISIVVVILVVTTGFVQYLCNDLEQDWQGVTQVCDFPNLDACTRACHDDCKIKISEDPETGSETTAFECRFHGMYDATGMDATCKNEMMFHDSLYYTIVTFSTVGYGDVAPVTWASRVAMVFLISITVWAVPYQLNKLQALKELQTEYDGVFRATMGRPHVILSCNSSVDVRPFVAEFFHEDHTVKALVQPQLVLLIDCLPSNELRHTLLKYAVRQRLFFVRGDATSAMDLGRARVDDAVAIFLLADRSYQDQDEQDQMTVLRALTARRTNPNVRVYAQMMQPENETLILNAGVPKRNVMCMNQMRLGLLGTSVACPGLPTMLLNLIQSISWRQSISVSDWHEEYSEGMTMEIYSFKLKTEMCGMRFADLALQLKKNANSCLFAIAHDHEIKKSVKSPVNKTKSFRRVQSQKGKPAATPNKRRSSITDSGPSFSRLTFNPGPDYKIVASDILFAFADEASRLEPYERFDEPEKLHKQPGVLRVAPSLGSFRSKSPNDKQPPPRSRLLSDTSSVEDDDEERSQIDGQADDAKEDNKPDGEVESYFANNESLPPGIADKTLDLSLVNGHKGPSRKFSCSETIARVPSNAPINSSLDALLSSIVETYGDASRGTCDHLKAYIKDQVSSLISLEEEETSPLPLEDYLILKAPTTMKNHVLVVCSSMDDMQYLLRPIRCSLKRSVPVIFITCKFPSPREWLEASQYGDVWVMQLKEDENGTINSAALREVLSRSGIQRARACLVCADLKKLAQSLSAADSSVMQAVLIAHELTKNRSDMILISELTQGGFSRKLALSLATKEMPTDSNPASIAKSAPEKNEHQSFTHMALEGKDGMEMQMEAFNLMQGFQHLESAYVAGSTIITSLLDLLVCQQYFNPYIMSIVYQIVLGQSRVGDEDAPADGKNSSIVSFKRVPAKYDKKEFIELFQDQVSVEGNLIMGLYRQVGEDNKAQHFVLTNPKPSTILRANDCMYVIRSEEHRNESGFVIPYPCPRPESAQSSAELSRNSSPTGAIPKSPLPIEGLGAGFSSEVQQINAPIDDLASKDASDGAEGLPVSGGANGDGAHHKNDADTLLEDLKADDVPGTSAADDASKANGEEEPRSENHKA